MIGCSMGLINIIMSLKDFQIISKLGEGAYSSVYKVKRLVDNTLYAMKKVKLNNLSQREQQNALNEVRLLASITHPNIIGYKETFIDKNTNYLYIIMEYADNGDLYQHIQQHINNRTEFQQPQIWSIFIQLVRGVKSLHDIRILHRDLKSANIFLFKNNLVKIGDLNVSKIYKGFCQTQTGTPYYASPQVWKDQPYDKKSDMWSLGCVLYETIALKPPFKANDMEGLYRKVIRGFYPRIPSQYSNQLSIVLKMLLQNIMRYISPKADKLLEFPMVTKHVVDLPQELLQADNSSASLLHTIKFQNKLVKSQLLNLPKPRYFHTIEQTPRHILPKIIKTTQKNTQRGDDEVKRQSRSMHINYQQLRQLKNVSIDNSRNPSIDRQYIDSEKKLPMIYQGRLRSISPAVIKKLLHKEKEKNNVYSIIGKQ